MRSPRLMDTAKTVPTVESRVSSRTGSETSESQPAARLVEPRWHHALSVAMMAGIAFLPIVIAAGFLAEHLKSPSLPIEVSAAGLRGPIDADRHDAADTAFVDRGSERSVRTRVGL